MAFGRVLLAWLVVSALFLGVRELERRLRGTTGPAWTTLRPILPGVLLEALLLTLLGALWFGSLGSGGAWLLYLLLGLLMELPARLRTTTLGALPWKPIFGTVLRVILAGLLLGLVLT